KMRAGRAPIAAGLPLVLALAAAGLGGCGDSSSTASGSAGPAYFGPSQPTPYQVISEGKPIGPPPDREDIHGAERRIAAASASGNCPRIADLYGINSASGSTPEACQLITQIGATTP